MKTAITAASIAAAQPGDILRDTIVPGLHVKVTSERRAYYLYFRTKDGTERRPKVGDHGALTLAQAREVARQMLALVVQGKDPMADRTTRREAPTIADLARRYWDQHASRQKAARDVRRHLDLHILPLLDSKRAVDIVYSDCERLHAKVAQRAPVQANRVMASFSKMLSLAERWQMRPVNSNPCKLVQRTRESARRRHMTGDEAPRIAAALERHRETGAASVAFIWLLLLSGARCGEIAAARWEWIEGNVLRLPDSKTGARTIFLPPQVLDLLAKLPRSSATITGILEPVKIWRQVREEAGCPDLRLHDLRRSFASAALSAGVSLSQIGELLGHRNAQTTRRYAYLMNESATAAAAVAASRITQLMGR